MRILGIDLRDERTGWGSSRAMGAGMRCWRTGDCAFPADPLERRLMTVGAALRSLLVQHAPQRPRSKRCFTRRT